MNDGERGSRCVYLNAVDWMCANRWNSLAAGATRRREHREVQQLFFCSLCARAHLEHEVLMETEAITMSFLDCTIKSLEQHCAMRVRFHKETKIGAQQVWMKQNGRTVNEHHNAH